MSYFRIKGNKFIKVYVFVGPGQIQIRPSLGSLLPICGGGSSPNAASNGTCEGLGVGHICGVHYIK
jgi:hypothetical protein